MCPTAAHPRIREAGEWPGSLARRMGWRPSVTLAEMAQLHHVDRPARPARLHSHRPSVIDVAGHVQPRPALPAQALPTLIVWGDQDRIIPVAHAYQAAEAMGGARLEILEGAGHFLPWRNADWFLPILENFLESTTPARARSALAGTPHGCAARQREGLAPADDVPYMASRPSPGSQSRLGRSWVQRLERRIRCRTCWRAWSRVTVGATASRG